MFASIARKLGRTLRSKRNVRVHQHSTQLQLENLEQRLVLASVVDVSLLGQDWSPAFLQELTQQGLGDEGFTVTQSQSSPLPWHHLNQVRVKFDAPVNVTASDLMLRGVRNPSGYALQQNGFSYEPSTNTATWTLQEPLPADSISIQLDATIQDNSLNPITGRRGFTVDVSPLASTRRDATDRFVLSRGASAQFNQIGDADYDIFSDVNGDGRTNLVDQVLISRTEDVGLPIGDPTKATSVEELASSLGFDPAEIFEYVVNTYAFQPYAGSMKTAQTVIETEAGGAWDLSKLLIELYEASGVSARYVYGTVGLSQSDARNLAGVEDPIAARNAFSWDGLNGSYETIEGQTLLQIDHTWVEADVWEADTGLQTRQLDPSWKLRDYQQKIILSTEFDEAGYLSNTANGSPSDYYARQVAADLANAGQGVSLADIPYAGPIIQREITSLDIPLPFVIVGDTEVFETIPELQTYRVDVSLFAPSGSPIFRHLFSLSEINPDSIVVGYNSQQGKVELYLDGQVAASGTPPSSTSFNSLGFAYFEPGAPTPEDASFTFSSIGGLATRNFLAIAMNANHISEHTINRLRDQVDDVGRRYLDGEVVSDYDTHGPALGLLAARYNQMVNESRAQYEALSHQRHSYNPEFATIESGPSFDVFPNQQVVIHPQATRLNVAGNYRIEYPISSAPNPAAGVTSYLISVHESLVFEDVLNTPGLSTVSSIQYANENGIPVFEITGSNFNTLLPQLNLPTHIYNQIVDDFNATNRVVVPRDMTPINGFNGIGWIGRGMRIDWLVGGLSSPVELHGGRDTGDPEEEFPDPDSCGQDVIADPVGVALGNVLMDTQEFFEPSGVTRLEFGRHYDSHDEPDRGLGVGWTYTYGDFLTFEPGGFIKLTNGQGVTHTFSPSGGGSYVVPRHVGGTFAAITGGYRYETLEGVRYDFHSDGRLKSILDRQGNGVQLTYTPANKLSRVTNVADASHYLDFTFNGDSISRVETWDGRAWQFSYDEINSQHYLASVAKPDHLGRTVSDTYTYYSSGPIEGLLHTASDARDSTTTYNYYTNRRVSKVQDPEGGIVRFSFDYLENETRVSDERGNITLYRYNDDGHTTEVVHPDGSRESTVWQESLVVATTDQRGFNSTFDYDTKGNLTAIDDTLGSVVYYSYDPVFNQPTEQTTQILVPDGAPTTQTFDSTNIPIAIQDFQTLTSATTVSGASGKIVDVDVVVDLDHTWNSDLRITLISPQGVRTTLASGVGGNGDDFENTVFDDEAPLSINQGAAPFAGTYAPQQALATYNDAEANGTWQLEIYDSQNGDQGTLQAWSLVVSTQAFATQDRVTQSTIDAVTGLPTLTSRPGGIDTGYTYTSQGLIDIQTDPLLRVTDFDYDPLGRLTKSTFAVGTADEGEQNFEYDSSGNLIAVIDENNRRTEYEHDNVGRLILTRDFLGQETVFNYDKAGNLARTQDSRGNITRNEYDAMNRLVRSTDADGNTTRFSYDPAGNLIRTIDPLGNVTRNRYDNINRLIEAIDADGGSTRFTYDDSSNLSSITDPEGNKTRFIYDIRGRLVQEIDPLGQSMEYEYDNADNLVRKTDRNNRVIEFEYDSLDRLQLETWRNVNTTVANVIDYEYDLVGNMQSVVDTSSSLSFTYDSRDRIKTVDNAGTAGVPNVLLTYTYDDVGNIASVVDEIGGVVGAITSYEYDDLNRLESLEQTGAGVATKAVDFAYNELGQFESISRYSDLNRNALVARTNYDYDRLNRLTALEHGSNSDPRALAFYDFEYDAASRITKITDIDGVTDYSYDNRGQLTEADRAVGDARGDESYSYDSNGNRTESHSHGTGYVADDANRLSSDGTYTYAYDDEGNMTRRTEIATGQYRTFDWDHRNRLIRVTDFTSGDVITQEVEYTYDGLDRRIAKHVDGQITYFVYDREDVILDFEDSDGIGGVPPVLEQRYLHGPGIDQVLAQEPGVGPALWLLADHQNSTRGIVDSQGQVVNQLSFDAYGNIASESNPAINTRYLYAGREYDTEVALHYNRSRYYESDTGRFISEDPGRHAKSGSNLYRYALNAPTYLMDWNGKEASSSQNTTFETGQIDFVDGITNNSIDELIGNILDLEGKVGKIRLVGHGEPGGFQAPGGGITRGSLQHPSVQKLIHALQQRLKPGGKLTLYSCNTGRGSEGEDFLRRLAELLGNNITVESPTTYQSPLINSLLGDTLTGPLLQCGPFGCLTEQNLSTLPFALFSNTVGSLQHGFHSK